MKFSDIAVQPLHNSRYKVLKAIHYKDVIVPIGYRTNGADIPRVFWFYIPPNWSDSQGAVIVHDYMCDIATEIKDYRKADRYFKEILEILNVDKRKANIMSKSVSFYTKYIRAYKGVK